jgi:hypothetical protein
MLHGAMLMSFMSHDLQVNEEGEYMIGMLEGKGCESYERSMISQHCEVQDVPRKPNMSSPEAGYVWVWPNMSGPNTPRKPKCLKIMDPS